jgi:phage gp36-like protein
MKSKFSVLSLLLLLLVVTHTSLAAGLVDKAVSENVAESAAAIEELRTLGPAGLNTLMKRYAEEIKKHIDDPTLESDAEWTRITKALDAVSGQKNSYLSGLYWYTDLKEAQKVAAQRNKPILSLRLLGRLTDELSCANSRFFRAVLYSNAEIASVLRDRFVLHWQSERPAPVVTIDFGDGRKLERTITGNSIHYVLDSSGLPVEAFPGLYGPQAFLRNLTDAEKLFSSLAGTKGQQRDLALRRHYIISNNKLSAAWYTDIATSGVKLPEGFIVERGTNGEVMAISIAPLAITKAAVEINLLRAMTRTSEALGKMIDETAWQKIAALHAADAVLDSRSIALIKRQNSSLPAKEFAAMLQKFQASIALDTVRNQYLMRPKLYAWLAQDPNRTTLEKLNEKVYAELFLTPRSDAWLGLLDKDVYTGIDNGGVSKN